MITRPQKHRACILLLICFFFANVSQLSSQNIVTIAEDRFEIFNEVEGGWLAADATISLLLPDGKTLWLFGDCFVGKKKGMFEIDGPSSTFINNAAIIEDGDVLKTIHGGSAENPSSLIPGEGENFFWPEHATIENDTIKIFAIKVFPQNNGNNGFNFRVGSTHLASFKYPEMQHINTLPISSISDTTMRFGTHVFVKDDYKYIFGKKDVENGSWKWAIPMLARVKDSVNEDWEFYAGEDKWTYDCKEAVPVGDRPMSESFFVLEKNNKFYLIMHEIWLVGKLYILEADKITGPWNRSLSGGIEKLFCVIEEHYPNITYNLFAHPQFHNEDSLLLSFNVNTRDFLSIYSDTRNYRGRFLWLSIEEAMASSLPDTISLFNDSSTSTEGSVERNDAGEDQYFIFSGDQIIVNNISSPSVFSIYDINGRNFYRQKIYKEEVIDLSGFPKQVLIVNILNDKGSFSKKILVK